MKMVMVVITERVKIRFNFNPLGEYTWIAASLCGKAQSVFTTTSDRLELAMAKTLRLLLLALTLSFVCASPQLLISKKILNEHIVEGKDLTLQYAIYNIGTSVAQSVMLEDETFPEEEFENIQGLLTVKWDRVNPSTNVSHIVIMKPRAAGFFNVSWARITYYSPENKQITGFSSAPGVVQVISYDIFSRKHEDHLIDWLAFVAMSAPTILLPLFLWYRSYSKYEKLKLKKA